MAIQRAPGAFAPTPMEGTAKGTDPAAFLAELQALGFLPGSDGAQSGAQPAPAPASSPMPRPQRVSALSELEALVSKAGPVRPTKGKFVPGKPGQPKSGRLARDYLRDPELLETLTAKIEAWETENPNRALMGSHIQAMLPEVSAAQARTILRKIKKAAGDSMVADTDSLMRRGAGAAMKG